jgi:hypothetical protein
MLLHYPKQSFECFRHADGRLNSRARSAANARVDAGTFSSFINRARPLGHSEGQSVARQTRRRILQSLQDTCLWIIQVAFV